MLKPFAPKQLEFRILLLEFYLKAGIPVISAPVINK